MYSERVPRLSPHGLSPRRLSPREDDDIRNFRPASVALGEPLFPGVTFFLFNGNCLGYSLTICGSSPEAGKVTEIMNYMVSSLVNTAARFPRATWIGTIFRTRRRSREESITRSNPGMDVWGIRWKHSPQL